MRLDLYIRSNLFLLLKNLIHISSIEKKDLQKLPRSFWQKEINSGNIRIQKNLVKPGYKINSHNISLLNISWKNIINNWNVFYRKHIIPYPAPLKLIAIEPDFIVINKPAGLSVHPAFPLNQKSPRETTLIEVLASRYPKIRLVHRLDKETSGLMLVARNKKAESYLKKQFKQHRVTKIYYALVEGLFPYKKFYVAGKIGKDFKNPVLRKMVNVEFKNQKGKNIPFSTLRKKIINPKDSLTFGEKVLSGKIEELMKIKSPENKIISGWKKNLKKSNKNFTLLKLKPKTGRTHQLRVHLNSIGFPVIGDKLYGGKKYRNLPFHCLHAFSLEWLGHNSSSFSAKETEIILF